ncbi:MAG: hypothetical protein QOF89_380 [Acidobacteriota bacterium]|jgi:hypothetical protein|nr:hypothetical protein [Acidobacteriota bacterium]
MTQRRIRRVAAATVLAMVLAFAAPAHAAGWQRWTAGPGWLEAAVQWIARLWTGGVAGDGSKAGHGIDPNGARTTATTTEPPGGEAGHGIDPNG